MARLRLDSTLKGGLLRPWFEDVRCRFDYRQRRAAVVLVAGQSPLAYGRLKFTNPIHRDVKPATGQLAFSSLRDRICRRTGVRDAD